MTGNDQNPGLRKKLRNLFYFVIFILGFLIVLIPFDSFIHDEELLNSVQNIIYNISAAFFTVVLIFSLERFFFVDENEDFRQRMAAKVDSLENNLKNLSRHLSYESPQRPDDPVQLPKVYKYRFKNRRLRQVIGLINADIRKVNIADIWVNSENTNMQMSRFYESTISGIIRFLGAKKNKHNEEIETDYIADELELAMGDASKVAPASILVTGPGEMAQTHNVKLIFHVAAVQGEVGSGYKPIRDLEQCIRKSLDKANDKAYRELQLTSILFPLIGTGTAGGELSPIAKRLIDTVIEYVETHRDNRIKQVYFLTYKDYELFTCQSILQHREQLEYASSETLSH